GTFDIGVVASRNPHRSFLCYGLHQERSLLYCANGHPLFADGMRRAAVAAAAFAMRGHSEDEQAFVEQGVLARAATAGNSDAVAALILTGEYIGFLPERYAGPFEQRGAIRALLPHRMTYRT